MLNEAVLTAQTKRLRRARLLAKAADRAQRIGVRYSTSAALLPLHNCGDTLSAFDSNLTRWTSSYNLAHRAFSLARKLRNDACAALNGGAL